MRILLSLLLLMISFVYSAEECRIELVKDISAMTAKSQKCVADRYKNQTNISWVRMDDDGTTYIKIDKTSNIKDSACGVAPIMIEKEICVFKPEPPEECKSGLKSRTWGKSVTVRIGGVTSTAGDKFTTYTCDEPPYSYDYIHPRTDEPIDDSDTDFTCTGSICETPDIIDKIDKADDVPCFGGACKPDYEKGETFQGMVDGVPCFATSITACSNFSPDYINGNGVPCWGDFCSNDGKAPVYKDDKGKTCVGPYCEGANGNLTDGSKVENGTVTGGKGSGSGTGTGTGEGTGESENNNNTCNNADCTGSSIGKGQKVDFDKDSIYESKYDSSFSSHVSKNPINIENTSLGRMVNSFIPNLPVAKCPTWTMPNLFSDDLIDLTPPCWIFDLIKSLVMISSLFLARKIVLGA